MQTYKVTWQYYSAEDVSFIVESENERRAIGIAYKVYQNAPEFQYNQSRDIRDILVHIIKL